MHCHHHYCHTSSLKPHPASKHTPFVITSTHYSHLYVLLTSITFTVHYLAHCPRTFSSIFLLVLLPPLIIPSSISIFLISHSSILVRRSLSPLSPSLTISYFLSHSRNHPPSSPLPTFSNPLSIFSLIHTCTSRVCLTSQHCHLFSYSHFQITEDSHIPPL